MKQLKRLGRPDARPYHHGSLGKEALREAHRILARKGADAVTIRAIARGVGVAPNALYRHFKDKNALLARLAEAGFRELGERFRSIHTKDPRKRFREMARSYVHFGRAKPAVLRLMFEQNITKAPKDSGLEQAAKQAFLELLEAAAAAAGIPAESDDSMQLAIACWSLVHGYTTLLTRGALDFVEPPHGIETVARFIELDPCAWSS
jgi:AcrR family transcriptional regulator